MTMETQLKEPEKKPLSREQFFSSLKPTVQSFNVPELGGEVVVRPISLRDREDIKSGSTELGGKINEVSFVALTLVKGLVDPKLTEKDVAELQQGNYGALKRIADRIWVISGIGEAEPAKNA